MGQPAEKGGVGVAPEELRNPQTPQSGEPSGHPGRWRREVGENSVRERIATVRKFIGSEAREQKREAKALALHTRKEAANSVLDELGFPYDREPKDLLQAIHEAEAIADKFGFRMIVVGGAALARHVDGQPNVKITTVNPTDHEITIAGARHPGIVREEDGSITDIDTIVVRKDGIDPFKDETRTDYELLKTALALHVARRTKHVGADGQAQPLRTPSIAVETVSYHPPYPKPNVLKRALNFNSRIDVYPGATGRERWVTALGQIQTEFKPEIMQTWRVKFADRPEDPGIPTLMIPAYRQRFLMRGPAVKEKDKKKVGKGSVLWNLRNEFYQLSGEKMAKQYQELMRPWENFTDEIQHSPKLLIQRPAYRLWWKYVGERIAHESGFAGVVLQPYRDVTNGESSLGEATRQALALAGDYLKTSILNRFHKS